LVLTVFFLSGILDRLKSFPATRLMYVLRTLVPDCDSVRKWDEENYLDVYHVLEKLRYCVVPIRDKASFPSVTETKPFLLKWTLQKVAIPEAILKGFTHFLRNTQSYPVAIHCTFKFAESLEQILPILRMDFPNLQELILQYSYDFPTNQINFASWAAIIPQLNHLKKLTVKVSCKLSDENLTLMCEAIVQNQSLFGVVLKCVPKDNQVRLVLDILQYSSICFFRMRTVLEQQGALWLVPDPDKAAIYQFNKLNAVGRRLGEKF
jgi:hypothetical protein